MHHSQHTRTQTHTLSLTLAQFNATTNTNTKWLGQEEGVGVSSTESVPIIAC